MSERIDVAIVGAGLSGLAAARAIVESGASCVVLEASDRVGGRTWSRPLGNATFDFGAQWIGPGQKRMYALVEELGIETFPTYVTGKKIADIGPGGPRSYGGFVPKLDVRSLFEVGHAFWQIEKMRKKVVLGAPWQTPGAASLDAVTVAEWKASTLERQNARDLFEIVVRSILAIDSDEASLLYFLFFVASGRGLLRLTGTRGGAQQDRFAKGSQEVSLRLAQKLGDRVRVESAVTRIRQGKDEVTLETTQGSVGARFAIVSAPPPLVSHIDFDPPLSAESRRLGEEMRMRGSLKFVVTYPRAFWRAQGLSGEAISSNSPVTVVFDNQSRDGTQPALVGFVRGRAGDDLGKKPKEERRRTVLAGLVRLFGAEADRASDYDDQYWVGHPWSGGCHGVFGRGLWTSAGSAIREPHGRVHWAGTETSDEWHGYMEGAVRAGERAAREVIEKTGAGR